MDHNEIRHKLSEYLDGAVTAGEKAGIEEHLKTCSRCSDALAELRKTTETVRQVEEAEPPAWMTSKIMARVHAEAEQKKSVFKRLFYPLAIKVPLQTVAVLFLVVTAFYIYRSIQPESRYTEAPAPMFEAKKEAPFPGKTKGALDRAEEPSARQKAPQAPEYRSLDMKYAYEKPAPPAPKEEAAGTASPAAPPETTDRSAPAKRGLLSDEHAATPQAPGAKMAQSNVPAMAGKGAGTSRAPSREKAVSALSGRAPRPQTEQIVVERHPNGEPKIIISYRMATIRKYKLGEEQFDEAGIRHGLQKEYYENNQLKVEAYYDKGKVTKYEEFLPDGSRITAPSRFEWFWLNR